MTMVISHLPPETNIAPRNGWLEYWFPFGMAYFQGRWLLVSGRMILQVPATLAGEYFGELALLTCAPRRATLRNSQVESLKEIEGIEIEGTTWYILYLYICINKYTYIYIHMYLFAYLYVTFICFIFLCECVYMNMFINYMYLNPIIPAQLITPPKTKNNPCVVFVQQFWSMNKNHTGSHKGPP